jgi:sodium/hydrogen antiporter
METNVTFWFVAVGTILLSMGLTANFIRRVPATTAMVYLGLGLILGPTGFEVYHVNPLQQSGTLEILTEIGVLISLFAAGIKMPVPFRISVWRAPLQLAFLSMAITVVLVAAVGYHFLALPLGAAVLLGAIMAPTDPVLATEVQVRRPGDDDELRFSLTSEAGLNDGSAFPFVMLGLGLLGLHDLGSLGTQWLLVDVLWATIAGVALGIACGSGLAHATAFIRDRETRTTVFFSDFLGLGLIALVYGLSLVISAWGFLAVFTAGVALRQTECKRASDLPQPASLPAEGNQPSNHKYQAVSEASLIFKEHLERLSEVLLILLVGGTLFPDSWSWRALGFATFLFLVARPVSVFAGLIGSGTSTRVKAYASWFGVKGIGSLYYLMYAIEHGLPEGLALELTHLVLVVVALSIVVHGVTVKPLIRQYGWWSRRKARQEIS